MRPFVPVLLAATVATAALTFADDPSLGALRVLPPSGTPAGHDEPFPPPITDGAILAELGSDIEPEQACISTSHIIGVLSSDVAMVGGEILALSGGLEQEFADRWRRAVGQTPVDVTEVFAHVVPSPDGDAIVDVIEIDAEGCALSRTLLSQSDWLDLLGVVKGVDV